MNRLIAEVIQKTAERYGYEAEDILSRRKHQHLAHARAEAMAEARKLGFSFPELAKAFRRDHTTVMHAVRGLAG